LRLKLPNSRHVEPRWAALVDPAALALAMPASWRWRRRLVSNSANTPSMSRKALPPLCSCRLAGVAPARWRPAPWASARCP